MHDLTDPIEQAVRASLLKHLGPVRTGDRTAAWVTRRIRREQRIGPIQGIAAGMGIAGGVALVLGLAVALVVWGRQLHDGQNTARLRQDGSPSAPWLTPLPACANPFWQTPDTGLATRDAPVSTIDGVTTLPSGETWAVGASTSQPSGAAPARTVLIMHQRNGIWTQEDAQLGATLGIAGASADLRAVAAVSPSDVWAVGSAHTTAPGAAQPLILHWDGRAWRLSAGPPVTGGYLTSVAAISGSDAWAAGALLANTAQSTSQWQALLEHWNGRKWSLVPTGFAGSGSAFLGIAATASNNVWLAGTTANESPLHFTYQSADSLLAHWDGRAWTVTPSPNVGATVLSDISAATANDVWAVGSYYLPTNGDRGTVIEHWDGHAWTLSPDSGVASAIENAPTRLRSISAVGRADAWAVGEIDNASGAPGLSAPLVEHWDGQDWSVVHASAAQGVALFAVASAGANNVWIVGGAGLSDLGEIPSTTVLVRYGCASLAPSTPGRSNNPAWAANDVASTTPTATTPEQTPGPMPKCEPITPIPLPSGMRPGGLGAPMSSFCQIRGPMMGWNAREYEFQGPLNPTWWAYTDAIWPPDPMTRPSIYLAGVTMETTAASRVSTGQVQSFLGSFMPMDTQGPVISRTLANGEIDETYHSPTLGVVLPRWAWSGANAVPGDIDVRIQLRPDGYVGAVFISA